MSYSSASLRKSAWYRMPVVWLALGLPLLTVAAGLLTIRIAASGTTDVAPESVQRVAQIQTTDVKVDERARQLDLRAQADIDPLSGRIRLRLNQELSAGAMHLQLIHPLATARDQSIAMQRESARIWTGTLAMPILGRYRVSLMPEDREWRLVGGLEAPGHALILQPAWATADD